jgi:hypothetical protein
MACPTARSHGVWAPVPWRASRGPTGLLWLDGNDLEGGDQRGEVDAMLDTVVSSRRHGVGEDARERVCTRVRTGVGV